MRKVVMLILAAAAMFADERLAEATGHEIDEVRDDDIVVVVRNEQIAIPKDQIDRLDVRPSGSRRRNVETKTGSPDNPNAKPPAGMAQGAPAPSGSYSTPTSIGGKADYETVYRRGPAASAKK